MALQPTNPDLIRALARSTARRVELMLRDLCFDGSDPSDEQLKTALGAVGKHWANGYVHRPKKSKPTSSETKSDEGEEVEEIEEIEVVDERPARRTSASKESESAPPAPRLPGKSTTSKKVVPTADELEVRIPAGMYKSLLDKALPAALKKTLEASRLDVWYLVIFNKISAAEMVKICAREEYREGKFGKATARILGELKAKFK